MSGESFPRPGHYKMRLTKGGPWVPVRIVRFLRAKRRQVGHLAYVGDQARDAQSVWPYAMKNPIPESEWKYLLDLGRWSAAHAPESPEANPRKAVDLNQMPTLF